MGCLINADVDVGIIPIRGCVDIVAAEIKKGGCWYTIYC